MWTALATHELRRFRYARGTWLYVGLCAAYTVVWLLEPRSEPEAIAAIGSSVAVGSLQASLGVLAMLGGLVVGFRAVVGDRESGTMTLVAGMPHTRRDVVVGKLAGRTAVVGAGIAVAVGCAILGELLLYGSVSVVQLAAVAAVTGWYALCWVAIGVAISTLARSSTEALAGAIGTALLALQWGSVTWIAYERLGSAGSISETYLFVRRLAPREAYHVVTNWILGVGNGDDVFLPMLTQRETDVDVIGVFVVDASGSAPAYLSEWLSLLVLGLWTIVPLAVTILRVRTTDLV
ncbi:ABC transporter permease subunit [Salinilacihabitans rarus]|uniref:ABC transporter permease subunit n=1 Tax=Salinilacihabitans rarus TaxID=2961596 RepID=UPI0020C8C27A|nr:ABC transporter permease subunit [Salinilacihabitans rarus]